jgi:hypothetical protein
MMEIKNKAMPIDIIKVKAHYRAKTHRVNHGENFWCDLGWSILESMPLRFYDDGFKVNLSAMPLDELKQYTSPTQDEKTLLSVKQMLIDIFEDFNVEENLDEK